MLTGILLIMANRQSIELCCLCTGTLLCAQGCSCHLRQQKPWMSKRSSWHQLHLSSAAWHSRLQLVSRPLKRCRAANTSRKQRRARCTGACADGLTSLQRSAILLKILCNRRQSKTLLSAATHGQGLCQHYLEHTICCTLHLSCA